MRGEGALVIGRAGNLERREQQLVDRSGRAEARAGPRRLLGGPPDVLDVVGGSTDVAAATSVPIVAARRSVATVMPVAVPLAVQGGRGFGSVGGTHPNGSITGCGRAESGRVHQRRELGRQRFGDLPRILDEVGVDVQAEVDAVAEAEQGDVEAHAVERARSPSRSP